MYCHMCMYFIIHGPPPPHCYTLICGVYDFYAGLFMIGVPSNSLHLCNIGDEGMAALGAAAELLSNLRWIQ